MELIFDEFSETVGLVKGGGTMDGEFILDIATQAGNETIAKGLRGKANDTVTNLLKFCLVGCDGGRLT